MITATVRQGDVVIAFISAPNQTMLDKALEPYPAEEYEIEQAGVPEEE